ncbi:MAG: DUF6663 family protein [Halobacteriota archaeon]|uniref:DUF6663 family protein n=1 Tax=Natronomonas sp. TaxID=2184060 RepID=UPI003974E8A1
MTRSTTGSFRVLSGRSGEEWLLLDVQSADPAYLPRSSLPDVSVGNRIAGDLVWDGEEPALVDATVETATRFRFSRTEEPIFEAARSCFETARAEGEAMNSRVTYGTDRDPNGVVYTFADSPGGPDLFSAFRDGHKPLDPLVARAAEGVDPPFSVWIIDPREPVVVVYIVLDPDGLLERTVAETYGQ